LFCVVTKGGREVWRGGFKDRTREEMLNGEMVFVTILVCGGKREL